MPKFLYDYKLYREGIPFLREVPLDNLKPHYLCIGASGSGKTYSIIILLAKAIDEYYRNNRETPILIIADYKSDKDFQFLSGLHSFFRYNEVDEALNLATLILEQRQQRLDIDNKKVLIFIDEWASYLASKSNKDKNDFLQKIARLMMLGRSYNVSIIIANQRGDAEYFLKVRDNFASVLLLGTLSKETVQMFLYDDKQTVDMSNARGVGYLKVSGRKLSKVIVPSLSTQKFRQCQEIIRYAVEESSNYLISLLDSTGQQSTEG